MEPRVWNSGMQNPLEQGYNEQRSQKRQRTLLAGKLVYGETAITIDCVIQNITDAGARVKIPVGHFVPKRLWLIDPRQSTTHEAEVVWHNHPTMGLKFIRNSDLDEASDAYVRLLRRIWIEMQPRRS